MTTCKHITNSEDKSFWGNIYFFDKIIFDQLLKKEIKLKDLSSEQYVEFIKDYKFIQDPDNLEEIKEPLRTYVGEGYNPYSNEVFIKEDNNKITELFIYTTNSLNEKNLQTIFNQASLKDVINFRIPMEDVWLSHARGDIVNNNNVLDITLGKLILATQDSIFDSDTKPDEPIIFDVPIGKHKIHEVYDQSYNDNILEEIESKRKQSDMIRLFEKHGRNEGKALEHGYDPDYYYGVKNFSPEPPNIHFLYIDFMEEK